MGVRTLSRRLGVLDRRQRQQRMLAREVVGVAHARARRKGHVRDWPRVEAAIAKPTVVDPVVEEESGAGGHKRKEQMSQ